MSETAETNTQALDFGFFDEIDTTAKYDELIGKDSTGGSGDGFFPMSYGDTPGTYQFRIYPEAYNGRPRFYREVWHHKLPYKNEEGKRQQIYAMSDDRIGDLVEWAEEKGLKSRTKGAWRYKAMKKGVLMVHMYEAPQSKYTKTGDTGLIMNYKQIDAFKDYLKKLEQDGTNLLQLLNPREENVAFTMTVTEDRKTSFGFTGGPLGPIKLELPQAMTLPGKHKFEGLDKLFVDVEQTLTDENYEKFKEYLEEEVENYTAMLEATGRTNNPDEGESGYNVGNEASAAAESGEEGKA